MRGSFAFQRVLIVLLVQGVLVLVSTQDTPEIPPIACPDNFAYLRYGREYIARITVPNVVHGTTQLEVKLTQREPVPSKYYGHLSLYQDQEDTLRNINNGRPVSYRLDFPIPNVLPKLLRISLNGDVICSSTDQSLGVVLNLQHKLQTPLQPLSAVSTELLPTAMLANESTFDPLPSTEIISTTTDIGPAKEHLNYQCGVSKSNEATSIIFNDGMVERGEHPWLVAIYQKQKLGLKFLCVGTLISARAVITAANFFAQRTITASQLAVYLGRYDLDDLDESSGITRNIESLIIHPEFNMKSISDADLAILTMSTAVSFTDDIIPICLWTEPTDLSAIVGEKGSIVSWYPNEDDDGVNGLPNLETGLIVSNENCIRSSEIFIHLTTSRTICAGQRDGFGPCLSDTGGGLILKRNGVWMLRGVVSAGRYDNGKCNLQEYIVYCDVAKHLKWVHDNKD